MAYETAQINALGGLVDDFGLKRQNAVDPQSIEWLLLNNIPNFNRTLARFWPWFVSATRNSLLVDTDGEAIVVIVLLKLKHQTSYHF